MSFEYNEAFKIAGLNIQVLKADNAWIIIEGEKATRVEPNEAALIAHWRQFRYCSDGVTGLLIKGESGVNRVRVISGAIRHFTRADGSSECLARGPHANWCESQGHCRKLAVTPNYAGPYIQENRDGEWVTVKYCAVAPDGSITAYSPKYWANLETIPMYLPQNVQFPVTININGKEVTYATKYHAGRTGNIFANSAKIAFDNGIKFNPGSRSETVMNKYMETVERNRKIHANIDALVDGTFALANMTIELDVADRATAAALLFKQLVTPTGVVYDTDMLK